MRLNMCGTRISNGEVVDLVEVKLTTRSITENLKAKARDKAPEEDIDPLPSTTVTAFKLLPRLAVFDWGKYVKGSGVSRKFTLELSKTQYGAAIRHYSAQADWLSSASIGTGNYFYENNRFAFGDLEPGQTYWFRIMHHTNNPAQNSNSDMTYFVFTCFLYSSPSP